MPSPCTPITLSSITVYFILWTTINKTRDPGQTRCAHGRTRRNALYIRIVQLGVCINRSPMWTTDCKRILLGTLRMTLYGDRGVEI